MPTDPGFMWGQATLIAFLFACGGGTIGAGDDDVANPDGNNNPLIDGNNPSVDVPGGVGEPAELAGITLAHNQVRAAVQTATPLPFLTWSQALADTAAAWAATCTDVEAPTGLVDHNAGRSDGHPYYVGENIYGSGGQATGDGAVSSWAAEKSNYTYATNSCAAGKVCGHYTQLVWRDTLEVGCALHDCPGLAFGSTIVCDYGPGGNFNGQSPY